MAFSHEVTLETEHPGKALAMIWIKAGMAGASRIFYLLVSDFFICQVGGT
jgi:hypothetical protein